MKRLWNYLNSILPFFAAEVIQIIIVNFLALIYSVMVSFQVGLELGAKGVTNAEEFSKAIKEGMSQNILYLFSVIAVLICGVIFFFWYRHEIRGEIRGSLRTLFQPTNILLFILLGVSAQLFFSGTMSLIQPYLSELFNDYANTLEQLTSGSDVVVLLLIVFAAPVTEELVFRGMILHKTSKAISFFGANLLQALLFGIYHWNVVQGFYAFFMGLLLGYAYRKFQTIVAPIFLHMLINVSAFAVGFVPEYTISYIIIMVGGGASAAFAIWRLKFR
jgi:uncharacterized protein